MMHDALLIVAVALAGGCGAACRYVLDHAVRQCAGARWPWGTWLVNVTGSLALGVLVGAALTRDVPTELTLIVGGGFLGAYTTFSTWMHESIRLMERRAWGAATLNVVGSVVAGVIAAAVGLEVARLVA